MSRDKAATWVWRCHIDLSTPNPDAIAHIVPFVRDYDASVWHVQQYVPAGLDGTGGGVHICPPAIDPLSPKNMALSPRTPRTCATSSESTSTGR